MKVFHHAPQPAKKFSGYSHGPQNQRLDALGCHLHFGQRIRPRFSSSSRFTSCNLLCCRFSLSWKSQKAINRNGNRVDERIFISESRERVLRKFTHGLCRSNTLAQDYSRAKTLSSQRPHPTRLYFHLLTWRLCAFARDVPAFGCAISHLPMCEGAYRSR